jgi:hypothetical protein
MELHGSFGMKWMPSALPGLVAWLFLPQSVLAMDMESHFSFGMKWTPFGSPRFVT